MVKRECGSCSECCFSLGVHELSKAGFGHCLHEKSGGNGCCAIYRTRPPSCAEFKCLWLGGFFGNKDRPDRIGVVLAGTSYDAAQPAVLAFVRKVTARGTEILDSLARMYPVLISNRDGRKQIRLAEGQEHLIPTLRAHMNDRAVIDEKGALRRLRVISD